VQFFSPAVPPNAGYAAYAIVHAALALCDPFHPFQRKVINAAWHVAPGDPGLATLRVALDIAVNLLGCLVVFAAGNDGTDNEIFPLYPARFSGEPAFQGKVLTALATDRYDAKTFFSNYGKTTVDLGAPGLRILSTDRYLVDPPRYADYSGTSPAAAYVSAGAALVFALHPENWDAAGAAGWTARDVAQHLKASADTIEDLKIACIDGKRLNLGRAVYGPLHVTAPAASDTAKVGLPVTVKWTTDYDNPHLTQVRIEFVPNGWAAVPLGVATIAAGSFAWTPTAAQLPPLPVTGLIRITPVTGNFPAESAKFQVVP
jgi:subtilisin family serine protease